jgi:inosine/xanthosine triphosphate pyrophosphatase family protein
VPDDQRQAQFHCVLVYLRHAEDPRRWFATAAGLV